MRRDLRRGLTTAAARDQIAAMTDLPHVTGLPLLGVALKFGPTWARATRATC
jgi:hypothetical protein